jgi:hypothetical protein
MRASSTPALPAFCAAVRGSGPAAQIFKFTDPVRHLATFEIRPCGLVFNRSPNFGEQTMRFINFLSELVTQLVVGAALKPATANPWRAR